jgi:hypothetical protein
MQLTRDAFPFALADLSDAPPRSSVTEAKSTLHNRHPVGVFRVPYSPRAPDSARFHFARIASL